MSAHLDLLAIEAGRQADQIGALALAANCVLTGSQPADPLIRDNAVLNILDVIEELAGRAEHAMGQIEAALKPI